MPAGTVTFTVDGVRRPGVAVGKGGVAEEAFTFSTAGLHTISAVYGGNPDFLKGSASARVTIGRAASTAGVAASATAAAAGRPITFTVAISGPSGTGVPTVVVTFLDGTKPLGSVPLDRSGAAVLPVASLAPGRHTITARYGGDGNHLASTSAVVVTITAVVDGPRVIGLQRTGYHRMPTTIILDFNGPLDPAIAPRRRPSTRCRD